MKEKKVKSPCFIMIGAQKSATTYLRQLLLDHPEVYMPEAPRELHFFDRSIINVDEYLGYFNTADALKAKVRGEKTPSYMHMGTKRIRLAKQIMGEEAKLILLLRNPVMRAWSHSRMEVQGFHKRKELTRKDYFKLIPKLMSPRNKWRTDYHAALMRWKKEYGDHQIFVAFYDEVKTNPQLLFDKVCDFLDVQKIENPSNIKTKVLVSKTQELPNIIAWYLYQKYKPMMEKLKSEGLDVPENWHQYTNIQPSLIKRMLVSTGMFVVGLISTLLYLPYFYAKEIYQLYIEPIRYKTKR